MSPARATDAGLTDFTSLGPVPVTLVALATDGRLRYDFQPAPPDPATWYSVETT